MIKQPSRAIRLGPAQYAVLAVTLLVVLPLIAWFTIGDLIYQRYVDEVIAPRVLREFEFEVGWVHVGPGESGDDVWWAITKVTPGSALDRAGIRRGDTGCLGIDTGGMAGIYSALDSLQDQTEVSVSLSNAAVGRQPCRTVTIGR